MDKMEQHKTEHWTESLNSLPDIKKADASTKTRRTDNGVLVWEGSTYANSRRTIEGRISAHLTLPGAPDIARSSILVKPSIVKQNGGRSHDFAGEKVSLRMKLPKLAFEEVAAAINVVESENASGLNKTPSFVWKELRPKLGRCG